MSPKASTAGGMVDSQMQTLVLAVGNLQGEIRGLSSMMQTQMDLQSEKSSKDSEFRHHVYNELGQVKARLQDTDRLSVSLNVVTAKLDEAATAHIRAEAAHVRIDAIQNQITPLSDASRVRRVMKSGVVQFLTIGAALAAVLISAVQWMSGKSP